MDITPIPRVNNASRIRRSFVTTIQPICAAYSITCASTDLDSSSPLSAMIHSFPSARAHRAAAPSRPLPCVSPSSSPMTLLQDYRLKSPDERTDLIEEIDLELCRHHKCIGVQENLYSPSTPIPIRRQRAPTCRLIAIREPVSAHTGRFSTTST